MQYGFKILVNKCCLLFVFLMNSSSLCLIDSRFRGLHLMLWCFWVFFFSTAISARSFALKNTFFDFNLSDQFISAYNAIFVSFFS